MEKNKLTEEQKAVLGVKNKSAIVSAAAGSGKTTILIDKIMDYISKGVSLENILALTFTNLAAGEMKTRLANKLSDEIETTGNIELLNQIDILPQADISTFHSFYEKIVKKYFYSINISPSFEIISSEVLLTLKEMSFKKAISNLKEKSFDEYLKISDVLGKKRSDNAIKERIFKLDNFLSSQFNKKEFIERIAPLMYLNKDETFSNFFAETFYFSNKATKEFEKLLKKAKSNGEEGLCGHINECLSVLSNLKSDYKTIYNFLNVNFKFPALRESGKLNIQRTETFEEVKKVKDMFKKHVSKFREKNYGTLENVLNSFSTCYENICSIINLFLDYENILMEEKNKINKYDFSDLETFCYEILQDEKIREEIKLKYNRIFVDEFQDINPIQGEILKLISKDNVLYVGDAKQSIYAFRQSDVDIFVDTCKQFEDDGDGSSLKLTYNFRSNTEILDFVNNVFNELMTESSAQINYEKDAKFKIDSNIIANNKINCENESVKVVCVLESKKQEEIPKGIYSCVSAPRNFSCLSVESRAIASEIRNLIGQKITDKFGNQNEINFKDIAILVRKRSNLVLDLIEVFKECNIPFEVNDEINLMETKENQLICHLINLIFNLDNDMSLAPVLCSDLFSFSFDELAEISLCEGNFFYEKCINYCKNQNNNIVKKLLKFYECLNDLSFSIQNFGIKHSLLKLFNEKKFFLNVLKKENGESRVNEIKQFLSHIKEMGFDYDVANLINYLNENKKIKVSSIKTSDENSVKITTIHSSKGLEFPIVILADCGTDLFANKTDNADIKIDKIFGVALKNYNYEERKVYNSIFETIIANSQKRRDIAENLRLLYVALTRAKNKLIITGKLDEKVLSNNINIKDLNNYKIIFNNIEKIDKQTDLITVNLNYLSLILGALKDKNVTGTNFVFENGEEIDIKKFEKDLSVDINKLLDAKKMANFNYQYKNNTNTAAKTSVSLIAFEGIGYESIVNNLENFKTSEHLKFSTPEEGNIIHNILEKFDFYDENLEDCVNKLIEEFNDGAFRKEELFEIIMKNVELIKKIIPKNNKIYKEKEFIIMESPFNIYGEGLKEKILIQGKIDFFSCGEKNILIDYKYTSIRDENKLIEKYKPQLLAYSFALEKATNSKIDDIYILSLKYGKLIKINV